MIKMEIKNKLAKEVLTRAIDKEIASLVEAMGQCNVSDFIQYQIYTRAKEQHEELQQIKKDLDQQEALLLSKLGK